MPQSQPGSQLPTNDELGLIRHRPAPRHGWRKMIHRASAGTINPGESEQDVLQKALIERVNQPVHGDYSIAVLSMKGGVGKTTVTVGLGVTFASLFGPKPPDIDLPPIRPTRRGRDVIQGPRAGVDDPDGGSEP